jgi:hypothetical protein
MTENTNESARDEEILRRLDTLISILRLAHADEIEHARTRILSDPVNAAVLKATSGGKFVASGDLKAKVVKSTKQSEKTVQRRVLDLVEIGALELRPTGHAAYRSTGLL